MRVGQCWFKVGLQLVVVYIAHAVRLYQLPAFFGQQVQAFFR